MKTKALISCAVTAQLICAFGFPYANIYANCWFSDALSHKKVEPVCSIVVNVLAGHLCSLFCFGHLCSLGLCSIYFFFNFMFVIVPMLFCGGSCCFMSLV